MSPRAASAKPRTRKSRRILLTRAERADLLKRRLFDAAVKVVGQYGYADATVSRITRHAGVAQGTFYNHFPNRQDLVDQLLPTVGRRMLDFIRDRVENVSGEVEREVARFRAFFDFLLEVPEFIRILNEAQVFAPAGYAAHIELISANYVRALKKGNVDKGRFNDAELEVIVHIMMGARSYLSHYYSYENDTIHLPPEIVFSAYEKLFRYGLFAGEGKANSKNRDSHDGAVIQPIKAPEVPAVRASTRQKARGTKA